MKTLFGNSSEQFVLVSVIVTFSTDSVALISNALARWEQVSLVISHLHSVIGVRVIMRFASLGADSPQSLRL